MQNLQDSGHTEGPDGGGHGGGHRDGGREGSGGRGRISRDSDDDSLEWATPAVSEMRIISSTNASLASVSVSGVLRLLDGHYSRLLCTMLPLPLDLELSAAADSTPPRNFKRVVDLHGSGACLEAEPGSDVRHVSAELVLSMTADGADIGHGAAADLLTFAAAGPAERRSRPDGSLAAVRAAPAADTDCVYLQLLYALRSTTTYELDDHADDAADEAKDPDTHAKASGPLSGLLAGGGADDKAQQGANKTWNCSRWVADCGKDSHRHRRSAWEGGAEGAMYARLPVRCMLIVSAVGCLRCEP